MTRQPCHCLHSPMVVTLGNDPPRLVIASFFGYACVVVPPPLNHDKVSTPSTQQHPCFLSPRHHHPLSIAITNQKIEKHNAAKGESVLARNICETIKAYSAGVIMVSNKTNQVQSQSSRSGTRLALTSPIYLTFVSPPYLQSHHLPQGKRTTSGLVADLSNS